MRTKSIFAAAFLCLAFYAGDGRADLILSGSAPPEDQGWSIQQNFPGTTETRTDGTTLRISTLNSPGFDSVTSARLLYSYSLVETVPGYNSFAYFTCDLNLQVHSAAYDYGDGSVVFVAGHWPILIFGEERITWGDMSQSFWMDTTGEFHTYRFAADAGGAMVYVDDTLALQDSGFVPSSVISFGDMTNDLGMDGDFSVRSIDLEVTRSWMEPIPPEPPPAPIPLPGAVLLGAIGLGVSALRLRR